jgi:UDP-N-acetylglucosamine 4,6-dehydratase
MLCKENNMNWNQQELLITGGTGSLGKALTKELLPKVKGIRIYSRDEYKQSEMQKEIKGLNIKGNVSFLIGDIRDFERVKLAMNGCNIVIHTAALKQVPVCEYNPIEAIQTNVIGSQNVLKAALANKVDKVMGISTDKAVYPINLYGATKMCMEKLFIDGNVYSKKVPPTAGELWAGIKNNKRKPMFSICRYGNVANSRGSVIPLFKKQYNKKGKITITDKRMTRFWITLKEAVKFVITCIEYMSGGEIFIPNIPSFKIYPDLIEAILYKEIDAYCFYPEKDVEFIGIRSGEKIHETLITKEESGHLLANKGILTIDKSLNCFKIDSFSSENNKWFLSVNELKERLKDI